MESFLRQAAIKQFKADTPEQPTKQDKQRCSRKKSACSIIRVWQFPLSNGSICHATMVCSAKAISSRFRILNL
jgi:hypothetical protein